LHRVLSFLPRSVRLLVAFALCACADDELKPLDGFSTDGMVQMVSPIRSPHWRGGRDQTAVWLKVVPNLRASAVWLEDQRRHALLLPPGTIAARIESWDGAVADVRGTRLEESGQQRFFVVRPGEHGLKGVEWPRGHPEAQDRATARVRALARDEASARHLARQNDCAFCHVHARAANTRDGEHGALNRPTDASGFFAIESVLEDEAPLEDYRPIDPNVDDPYVEVICGDVAPEIVSHRGERHAHCPDGRVPRARYDLPRALSTNDPHASQVCASRRALYAWSDHWAREAFAPAFEECERRTR
jgi:hypothetical protein